MERATCASGSNGTHDALHRSSYNSDAGNLVRQRGQSSAKNKQQMGPVGCLASQWPSCSQRVTKGHDVSRGAARNNRTAAVQTAREERPRSEWGVQ